LDPHSGANRCESRSSRTHLREWTQYLPFDRGPRLLSFGVCILETKRWLQWLDARCFENTWDVVFTVPFHESFFVKDVRLTYPRVDEE
jgi:hypothetical protein